MAAPVTPAKAVEAEAAKGKGAKRKRGEGAEGRGKRKTMIIAMYANKGGVGKSTSCIELASILAEMGYTVLLVDYDQQVRVGKGYVALTARAAAELAESLVADVVSYEYNGYSFRAHCYPHAPPTQANLSTFFNKHEDKRDEEEVDGEEEESDGDESGAGGRQCKPLDYIRGIRLHPSTEYDIDAGFAGKLNFKKWDGAVFSSTVYSDDSPLYKRFERGETKQPFAFEAINLSDVDTDLPKDKMFLVPGTSKITSAENALVAAERFDQPIANLRTLGSLRAALLNTAEVYDTDFVLIDLGPYTTALNRNAFLSADLVIPLAFPDTFNAGSMHALFHQHFPEWYGEYFDKWCEKEDRNRGENKGLELNREKPFLAPVLVNNFATGKKGDKKMGIYVDRYDGQTKEVPYSEFVKLDNSNFCAMIDNLTKSVTSENYPKLNEKFLWASMDSPDTANSASRFVKTRSVSLCKSVKNGLHVAHDCGQPLVLLTKEIVDRVFEGYEVKPTWKSDRDAARAAYGSLARFVLNHPSLARFRGMPPGAGAPPCAGVPSTSGGAGPNPASSSVPSSSNVAAALASLAAGAGAVAAEAAEAAGVCDP